MDNAVIDGVITTPQKIINVAGGGVYHAMKRSDASFCGFGEVYFSKIENNVIKAWKRHREMTLNLIVPVGAIRFVLFDDRVGSLTESLYQQVILSCKNYSRLTVPPMVWMGFQGVSEEDAMLLNIANITHNPSEVDRKDINDIEFNWNE
jgi:dTDP-4-dehydrorhamnose 3,5-epimerase